MKRIALGLLVSLAVVLSACARNTPVDQAVLAPPSAAASSAPAQPDHVSLPQDDAPHADLTEWWYYTGHLAAAEGKTYGFELVIFQALRSTDPPAYAAHFAITDNGRQQFHFAERSDTGAAIHAGPGFDLNLDGWVMKGADGHDHLTADMPDYRINLDLSPLKPAVLHEGKGLISFGPAGDSYYYSRTRNAVAGAIVDHGQPIQVSGTAWMDHQWGNFVSGGGGWDWFSIQLNDQSELMLFFLRDSAGKPTLPYGTLVDSTGKATILPPSSFKEQATGSWTSPASGITYPSGWEITAGGSRLTLTPTVKDQELRTEETTGVTYWEGDVSVSGTQDGKAVGGQGYVELVGYH